MTREETTELLHTLMAPWSTLSARTITEVQVDTYHSTLGHLPVGEARAALGVCLKDPDQKYPPTPSDIIRAHAEAKRDKLRLVGPYRSAGARAKSPHHHHPTISIDPDTGMEVYAVEMPDGKGGTRTRHYLRATKEQRSDYREQVRRYAEEGRRLKAERTAKKAPRP